MMLSNQSSNWSKCIEEEYSLFLFYTTYQRRFFVSEFWWVPLFSLNFFPQTFDVLFSASFHSHLFIFFPDHKTNNAAINMSRLIMIIELSMSLKTWRRNKTPFHRELGFYWFLWKFETETITFLPVYQCIGQGTSAAHNGLRSKCYKKWSHEFLATRLCWL